MFNLEKAIADWRRQMAAGGIRRAEVLDELESHLRDDVEQQMRSGVTALQAFEAAVQRIGQVSTLKAEFMKAAGAVRVPVWKRELIPSSMLSFWQKNQRMAGALASGMMAGCVSLH